MKIKIVFVLLSSLFIAQFLPAQIAVGAFRQHLPYHIFHSVAATQEAVYVASKKSIFVMDKADHSQTAWSTVEGLSDVGVSTIACDHYSNMVIIAYDNANIDIVRDGKITNIPDIKNKQFTGSKQIYNILIKNAKAYLATAFGVIVINLKNNIIEDTWFTYYNNGYLDVQDIKITDNDIYIATNRGIYRQNATEPFLANFTSWQLLDSTKNRNVFRMALFADKLFFCTQHHQSPDSIYLYDNGNIHYLDSSMQMNNVADLQANNNLLAICDDRNIYFYDKNLQLNYHTGYAFDWVFSFVNRLTFYDDDVWIADGNIGLIQIKYTTKQRDYYYGNGPYDYAVQGINVVNGKVAIVPGSRNGLGPSWQHPSLSTFEHGEWKYVESSFYEFGSCCDINNVVINPRKPTEIWCASWGWGIYKVEGDKVVAHYDASNSPIRGTLLLTSGLCFDNNNNLWITNSSRDNPVDYPLHVLQSSGKWQSFSLLPAAPYSVSRKPEHVFIDSRGYKWVTFSDYRNVENPLLVVLDDKNTIENQTDDRIVRVAVNYNSTDAEPKTDAVTCIAEDLDGAIWLGTDKGVKVIYYPENVFTNKGAYYAQYIKFMQNGYGELLMGKNRVTAIAVDGANRKWIGTEAAGLFLVSANGTEQLLHFTKENSPLFADNITSIAIDHENGEVFIGTINGLISYRGDAIWGKENYEECKVFPNPVREDYLGVITVSGLMKNSFCKIADAEGKLVWQGYANGGELVWNGKDFYGARPATGVYYVFASNPEGKEKKVAKFLMIH